MITLFPPSCGVARVIGEKKKRRKPQNRSFADFWKTAPASQTFSHVILSAEWLEEVRFNRVAKR
jgi:hypothetical protein